MQIGGFGLALFTSLTMWGQEAGGKLQFDAATIKPAAPGRDGGMIRILPGGQTFTASNVALRALIMTAYGARADQVSGGAAWANNDGWDIQAKTSRRVSGDELMQMLRALLVDRFQLALRDEKKEQPVYSLVVEKTVLGLRVNTDGSELTFRPAALGHYTGTNVTMAYLAWSLGRFPDTGRVVVDKTGLKGGYDFELEFAQTFGPANAQDSTPGPSLFTALREQMGLKLEPGREPVDFYTIEHAERPSGN
jgi:bla regulator protein BlaR1